MRGGREARMVYKNIAQLIGNTPLLEMCGLQKKYRLKAQIFAKLEYFNPTGSVKDRPALAIVEALEREGKVDSETLLIEPTSGNTGIGLAAVCAMKGYHLLLTMPETMSEERRKLLSAFGAEIVLTEGRKGMAGAIEKAEQLHRDIRNSVICGQFTNPANPESHYLTTGPELYGDLGGAPDFLVAGVGTGGTLAGTARFLKEKDPSVRAVAVEPENSAVLSGKKAGPHGLQGIGAGFVPEILDVSLIDEVIPVSDKNAYKAARVIARTDGVFAGISAGAAVWAAVQIAKRKENAGKRIAVIIPDTGMRYLSTELFSEEK